MDPCFLSCDWGTSSFRLRLVNTVTGAILQELVAEEGIKSVYEAWLRSGLGPESRSEFYFAVLSRHISELQQNYPAMPANLPVIVSGMASSNIGIAEIGYKLLPLASDGSDLAMLRLEQTDAFPHTAVIISGACTATDVMRGEETQLVGCAGAGIDNALFIFPGTHSKHINVENGVATGFKTYMTGEVFALLGQHSILASSIAESTQPVAADAFARGVQTGIKENILHALFTVRTNGLFNRLPKEANYHYLSGLLIGAELKALSGNNIASITLVGETALMNRYVHALDIAGIRCPVQMVDAAMATVKGQLVIYKRVLVG